MKISWNLDNVPPDYYSDTSMMHSSAHYDAVAIAYKKVANSLQEQRNEFAESFMLTGAFANELCLEIGPTLSNFNGTMYAVSEQIRMV